LIYNSFDNPGLVKVLTFLQTHNTEYLSGQDLSDVLKISRVAVWKHIKKIQELGYTVESKQKLGYKLISNSELLLPWEITSNLKTKSIGQQAYYFDSIDSTQNQALKMADDPANEGVVIVAEKQTGGRGRSGRKWVSPKGGIWISIILQPEFDISITTLFPIASALALSIAIEKTFSILVLGVGINFDVDVKQIEKSLKGTPNFYGVASLKDHNQKVKPIQLVQTFLLELEKIYKSLSARQTKKIISEWTLRSSTIGKNVELNTTDGKIKGKAVRIDDDGTLIISENNKTHKVIAGDIVHLSK
jgi:BirA family biotin operon repressor/biotin-[acetyl-CoA-carboxylase] ligase